MQLKLNTVMLSFAVVLFQYITNSNRKKTENTKKQKETKIEEYRKNRSNGEKDSLC